MKVIIPLAGFGTRMRPHTWSRAKPLLNVATTLMGNGLSKTGLTLEKSSDMIYGI